MPDSPILIAEDDTLMAELIQHRLEKDGHDTVVAVTGEDALAQARSILPAAIILDGMLPGIDGFEILRILKEEEDTQAIPIIMLTARGLEKDVVDGLSLGAEDYIVKPFMPNELSARLKKVLMQAKARGGG